MASIPAYGIDVLTLGALVVDPLPPAQARIGLDAEAARAESLAQLVDRLGNRLGSNAVVRLARASEPHSRARLPRDPGDDGSASGKVPSPQPSPDGRGRRAERAGEGKAADHEDHRSRQPRPINLLASPEPIEVVAPVPDGPPALFRWRRTRYLIARAEGPERIGPEWWLAERRARRRGVVPHPRLLPGRGQRRPALLDLPRGLLPPRPTAALVPARDVRVRGAIASKMHA